MRKNIKEIDINETIKKINWLLLKHNWNKNQWNHIITAKKEINKLIEIKYTTAYDQLFQDEFMKKIREIAKFISFKNRKARNEFIHNFINGLKEDIKNMECEKEG